jgi:hypothetical protein
MYVLIYLRADIILLFYTFTHVGTYHVYSYVYMCLYYLCSSTGVCHVTGYNTTCGTFTTVCYTLSTVFRIAAFNVILHTPW